MKFSIKNYFHPTPRVMKLIGDSLLAISASLSLFVHSVFWVKLGTFVGILGKFVTNMFSTSSDE